MRRILLVLCSLMNNASAAEPVYPWEIRFLEDASKEVRAQAGRTACGQRRLEDPACEDLADQVCKALFSAKHYGNMDVPGGRIRMGYTDKNALRAVTRMDYEALIAARERLPADLRELVRPALVDLKRHLAKERDSREWYRDLSNLDYQVRRAIHKAAALRTEKRLPGLRGKSEASQSVEDRVAYQEDVFSLENEVLEAKYETHPNWVRVRAVFKEAREDLLAEVRELPVPPEFRDRLIRKVESVELSLPFEDPRKLGARPNCAHSEESAYYFPSAGKLTVCAGYFNGVQSREVLYGTLAHELSHSIDPGRLREDEYEGSAFAGVMRRLSNSRGPVFACDDWATIRGDLRAPAAVVPAPSPLDSLAECLVDRSDLDELNVDNVRAAARDRARQAVDYYASNNAFTLLAQSKTVSAGREVPNELYLRPDRLAAGGSQPMFAAQRSAYASAPEIFVQVLSCARTKKPDGRTLSYVDATGEERQALFDRAIFETRELLAIANEQVYSFCGRECDELVGSGLARESEENFADWLSNRAIRRAMRRDANVRSRRNFASLNGLELCERPDSLRNSPDLLEVESLYSAPEPFRQDSHADGRERRLSLFDEEGARLTKCAQTPDITGGFGSCEL